MKFMKSYSTHYNDKLMHKPTFIVIGPGRVGTSWMYEILLEHPEVCMATGIKETHFFNAYYHKGSKWYYKFFSNCRNVRAIGEISNLYFYDKEVPKRIHELLPDVKLITCLRDPLERMASVYLYRKRSGELDCTFEKAIEQHPDLLYDNFYYSLINNYLQYFSREQMTILFYEDLKQDPQFFVKQLFRAIHVDEHFKPVNLYRTFNRSNKPRLNMFSRGVHFGSNFLRNLQMYAFLNKLKRNQFLRKLLFTEIQWNCREVIPNHLKYELIKKLKGEIEGIEVLTGENLDEWKKVR